MDGTSETQNVRFKVEVDTSMIGDLTDKLEHLGEILKEVNSSLDKLTSAGIHLSVVLEE